MPEISIFLTQGIAFLESILPNTSINLLDIIIVVVIIYYAIEGYMLGFIMAFFDLLSFLISFLLALKYYAFAAGIIVEFFNIPIGFAHAGGFFIIALLSEILINVLFRYIMRFVPPMHPPLLRTFGFFGRVNHLFGIIPGMISAFIVLAFLLTVIVSLPSSPLVKRLVTGSEIGSRLIAHTSFFERRLNDVFGGAIDETLTYLTVRPESDEMVELRFEVDDGTIDENAEAEMLRLVNIERAAAGLTPVVMDAGLVSVARSHSQDMLSRGYFSHYTPEGRSPFDRMDEAGIDYTYAGENLALAPSTPLAMQGLMDSPGHRANILNPNFNRLGVGAIDGGIYGIMFSQEFTN